MMLRNATRFRIGALLVMMMFLCTSTVVRSARAGDDESTLKNVESQLGQHKHGGSSSSSSTPGYYDTYGIHHDVSLLDALFAILFNSAASRSDSPALDWTDMHRDLRSEWSPLMPTARVESAYHYITGHNDINAFTLNATAGYLLCGADIDYVNYFESTPNTQLKIISPHGLFRVPVPPVLEIDLAVGAKIIRGSQTHQGTELGMPIYIFAGKHVIFDVKPYWAIIQGTQTSDIAVGVSYKWKPIGVRASYRWIKIGTETLHGPTIGLFAQW